MRLAVFASDAGHAQHNKCTQLLFATDIERGIHDRQVLKYQPLVTSRLIFQHLIITNGIR